MKAPTNNSYCRGLRFWAGEAPHSWDISIDSDGIRHFRDQLLNINAIWSTLGTGTAEESSLSGHGSVVMSMNWQFGGVEHEWQELQTQENSESFFDRAGWSKQCYTGMSELSSSRQYARLSLPQAS